MKNFEWKQIDWFEADSKIVFDDSFGFVWAKTRTTTFEVISPDFPGSLIRLANCFYIGESDDKVKLDQNNIPELFSRDIYVEANPPKKMNVQSLHIQKRGISIVDPRYGSHERSTEVQITRENLSAYPLQTWFCEEIQNMPLQEILKLYQRPLFLDLQVGQAVFHKDLGKCTVVKIYEQPDTEDRMVDIQTANQKIRTIKFSGSESNSVYKIPYQSLITNESEQFNVCKNELQLSPYMLIADKQINIYWQQIPNAARYIISLYKRDNRPYLQQIYPLKDYIVERSEGFLSIKDLLGSDYIAVVKAEDRSGEIIAKSRGIAVSGNKSYPQFWK